MCLFQTSIICQSFLSILVLLLSNNKNTAVTALFSNAERSPQKLSDVSDVCSGQQGRTDTCEVDLDVPIACIDPTNNGESSCPIVFFLHGAGGTNNGFASRTSTGVHSAGFIGVYPQGENGWNTGPKNSNQCTWDDFDCTQDPDEGAFIAGIIAEIRSQGGNGNIYVIGSSNGAALANRLAVNAGEQLPIAGIVTKITQLLSSPDRSGPGVLNYNNPAALGGTGPKVSVLNVMGTDDGLIKYEGGSSSVFSGETAFQLMSALDSMEVWATHNGCSPVPSTRNVATDVGDGTGIFYDYFCSDGTIVEHYAIHGGTHADSGRATIDGIDFSYDIALDFIHRVEQGGVSTPTVPTTPTPIAPTTSTPSTSPTEAGSIADCVDDPTWSGKFNTDHTCSYVAAQPAARCAWEDTAGVTAMEACQVTCGTCPTGTPMASPTVATSIPTQSPVVVPTTSTTTPTTSDCVDDLTWSGKFNTDHTCSYVASQPAARCNWEDAAGVKAMDACQVTCGTCSTGTPTD